MICIAYFTIVQLVVLIVFGDGVLGEMILSAIYIQYILGISGDLYALWYLHLCISSPSPSRWSGIFHLYRLPNMFLYRSNLDIFVVYGTGVYSAAIRYVLCGFVVIYSETFLSISIFLSLFSLLQIDIIMFRIHGSTGHR